MRSSLFSFVEIYQRLVSGVCVGGGGMGGEGGTLKLHCLRGLSEEGFSRITTL